MPQHTILVTGATGTLGRPTVQALRAAGHRVRALARSAANESLLHAIGVEPVAASLFDPSSLGRAVRGADAVLHLATRIPPIRDMQRPGAWGENDRIRTEGTRNLVDAALAAGVRTFIYPGIVFGYPDGGAAWIDAACATPDSIGPLGSSLVAEAEVARFAREGGGDGRRGIVLRMGYFYGAGVSGTGDMVALARRGVALVVGRADAYFPQIWVDDAAAAVVAALERAPGGIWDVVEDEPTMRGELVRLLARAAGRRWLVRPPTWLVRLTAGADGMFAARSQRVSNRRFREAAGWSPSVPSGREGWRLIAGADRARPAAARAAA